MTTTTEAAMTTHDTHNDPEPLGAGWTAVTVVIGILAALIALAGMTLSFHAVSVRMTPSFGPRWAWLVPLVVDLTVLVFSGVDLVLNRLGMSHPLARATVYGATFGTVALNYAAGGDPAGRIAHVLMPSVWVMFVELMRHVVRRTALKGDASLREPIPAARWMLSPWPTLKLWRRMVLWRTNSYPAALAQERVRLARIAALRDTHGRAWRWKVSALDRLSIALGEADTRTGQAPHTDRTAEPDTDRTPHSDTPDSDRTARPDSAPTPNRTAPRATGQPDRTARPDSGRPTGRAGEPDKPKRASLPELIVACQNFAVENEIAPEHLTRAQIKKAVEAAGYTVSNDRVTRISEFFDEEAAK